MQTTVCSVTSLVCINVTVFVLFLSVGLYSGGVHSMKQGRTLGTTVHSWLAGLLTHKWHPRCSGSLITKHWVLTASACVVRKMTTMEILDPTKFIIVIPSYNNSVRSVDIFIVHPRATKKMDIAAAGLVGVSPAIRLGRFFGTTLHIWDYNPQTLKRQFGYVLDNIACFRCSVITWKSSEIDRPKDEVRFRDEVLQLSTESVSEMDVMPITTAACIKNVCNGAENNTFCKEKLEHLQCVQVLDPPTARFCSSDRGAGLVCGGFLWGILIGGTSCDDSLTTFPMFSKLEENIEFIVDETFGSYKFASSSSPEFAMRIDFVLHFLVLGPRIWRIIHPLKPYFLVEYRQMCLYVNQYFPKV